MQHLCLKQHAYKIIKAKILNLEFKPGSRIREDLLASEISMSRTPVREAINQLAVDGFIKIIPRKGLFCVSLDLSDVDGLLDVRESLERLAIEKCIEKITAKQLTELEKLNLAYGQAIANRDIKKCNEIDSDFHMSIARISKNKKLIEFMTEIEEFMHIARVMERRNSQLDEATNQDALLQHKLICECLKTKDTPRAIMAIQNNIKNMKHHLGIGEN